MSAWFDAHAHPERMDLEEELARCREAGVVGFVAVGTDLHTSAEAIRIAETVRARGGFTTAATVGVHPHDSEAQGGPADLARLAQLARSSTTVAAIGECGLDYYYDHSPRQVQRRAFADQVRIAAEADLALVVHTRDAWTDTVAILDDAPRPRAVVIHSFSEGPAQAEAALERGWYVSFSGIVTFKNAGAVRAALAVVPAEHILVETDAPFLAPVPLRGKPNHIANVAVTGRFLAEQLGVDPDALAETTQRTTRTVFAVES
jgi:TatD DNase family protein